MSFSDDYNALKKKRKKEEEKQVVKKSSGSFSDDYNSLKAQRPAAQKDIAPVFVNKTAALYTPKKSLLNTEKKVENIAPVITTRAKTTKEKEKERKWFDKGAFDDGYQFGDVAKTILGSTVDVLENAGAGILGMGEKLVDTAAYLGAASYGGLNQMPGSPYPVYSFDMKQREEAMEDAKEFIKKDLYDEEKIAEKIILGNANSSVLGEKSDSLLQSAGQLGATAGLQAVGVPWFVTTGVTSFGGELEGAFDEGASYGEAGLSAAISAGAEILTEQISGGIKFGGKTLDDGLTKALARGISDKTVRTLSKLGVDMAGEGAEEVLSGAMSAIGKKLTYADDKELSELFTKEEAVESFIGGAVLGGVGNVTQTIKANKQGVDAVTGLTAQEQSVVDKIYNDRLAEEEQNGTGKKKSKIYDEVLSDMDKGYISTDTIEEVLGGDTYKTHADTLAQEEALQKEYDSLYKMKNGEKSDEQIDRQAELKKQLEDIKQNFNRNQLGDEVFSLVQGSRLAESYNERGRRSQAFEADLTQYDSKYQDTIKKAVESGILNNTNRTHEFVDMIAKISADKGVLFDFTNNSKLKDSGFAVDGKQVNGFVTKDGVTLNIDSAKSLNSVVGHEITHVLEGTELYDVLSQTVLDYAKSKGDYQGRYDSIAKLYEGVEGANVDAELTADLVGDYLFTDTDFINSLSVNNRNVFQKIYDEIKYLCKVATAGSKEARELEKVKRAFEKAYKEGGKQSAETEDADTKYSLVTDKETIDFLENQDYIVTYKAMQIVDGKLYPPMSAQTKETVEYTDKKGNKKTKTVSKWKQPSELGRWQQSDENPGAIKKFNSKGVGVFDLIKGNGKTIQAAYNPYEHTSNIVLNDQFEEAYNRDNLVTVEYHIPVSELTSGYKAQYAKDAVGLHEWKSGPVAKDLKDPRKVYLTRWSKPVRVLPDSEVAAKYKEILDGTGLSVPFNVVTPSLLAELEKAGVSIDYEGSPMYKSIQKRANEKKAKYSLTDSDGNKLSKGQQEYFKDSKVRDENGNLLKVYHGSANEFTVFNGMGNSQFGAYKFADHAVNYFTTAKETAEDFARGMRGDGWSEGNVYEGYVNATNPYIFKDERESDYGYSTANGLKNRELREFEISLFEKTLDKLKWTDDVEEVNEMLLPFNARVKDYGEDDVGGDRYELFSGGGNFAFSSESFVTSADDFYDLFYDEELLTENIIGVSERWGDDDYYYTTDQVVNLVIAMNKYGRKDYDAVIIDNIFDAKSFLGRVATDVITIKSSNQFKNADNLNPTADKDIRYSLTEYNEEEKTAHNKAVLDHFGKTYKWAETGYVLLDGSRLDLSGKHEGAPGGYRTVDHRDIVAALGSDYGDDTYSGSLVQFMSEGNIRISPESNGINLSVKPNKAQEKSLSNFISSARGEVLLDIDGLDGYTVVSVEYPRGTHANKVLNDIREWFDNGKKPEVSNLSQFRSLSAEGEAPTGRGFYGKDMMLETTPEVEETVAENATVEESAPVVETATPASPIELADIAKQARREEFRGAYTQNGKQYLSDGSFIAEFNTVDESLEQSKDFPIKRAIKELDEAFERRVEGNYDLHTSDTRGFVKVGNSLFGVKRVNALIRALENPTFSISNVRGGHEALVVTGDNGRAVLMPVSASGNAYVVYEAQPIADAAVFPDDLAPMSEEMEADRLDSLTDADAPPMSDVYAPTEEDEAFLHPQQGKDAEPFEDRDFKAVGDRKVNAYMYDNPEVKPFFQNEALVMLGELDDSQKGERWVNWSDHNGKYGVESYYQFDGVSRSTSDDIAYLLDNVPGTTYDKIRTALNAIVEDNGRENNALSKRIEFILDERLRNGYKNFGYSGYTEANQEYIDLVNRIETSNGAFDSLVEHGDELAPPVEAAPAAEESTMSAKDFESHVEEIYNSLNNGKRKVDGYSVYINKDSTRDGATITIKQPNGENIKQRIDGGKYWTTEQLRHEAATMIAEAEYPNHAAPTEEAAPVAAPAEDIAPVIEKPAKEAYEAIKPKKEAQPRMAKATPEEQARAEILTEEPKVDKKKSGLWARVKNNVLDKGMVFEDLSLATGDRELQARWNSIRYADAKAQHLMEKGNAATSSLDSIRKAVEKTGKTKEFYEYLYHMHNADRMTLAERYENMENKPVFGYDVTSEMSREAAAKLEKANPQFKQFAKDVYNYMGHLREMLVSGGVISRDTAKLWAEMYPHYVPVRRVGDEGLNINVALDTRKTGVNAPIKRATGGNRDILPLFDTMGQRTMQTYKAIAKNRFGVRLKDIIGTTIDKSDMDIDEAIEGVNDEGLLQEGKDGKAPTFTVFENGEKVTFEITEEMYDAIKPVSGELAVTHKIPNAINNVRRGLLTEYNPVFMLTNPIKDAQDVLLNSQHPARTYANFPKAVAELVGKKGRWYQEYMENGGEQNTYFERDTNTFKKEKSGLSKAIGVPFEAISAANNFIERIPRMAEYIASRREGRSIDVAMLDAARVTTNFAAGGDLTKWANRNGATFLNASVQGAVQQVRNIREAKANGVKGVLSLAAKVAMAGLPSILLNNLLWDDDEEYEELSDYVKQGYYIVGKTQDGKFVRIPKGRALAVIQNAFEQVGNMANGEEADWWGAIDLAFSNLAPNNPLDNNILSPVVQTLSNRTWYGEDLVPTRLQDLPAAEQYDESTDSLSKWLGEKLNISPVKLNYLIDQYSGGIGDTFLPMLTPEAESGDDSFVGNMLAPLKDKFTTDGVMNNQNISDFYDKKDELAVNANASAATDEDVLMSKYMNSVSSEVGELYGKKREIQSSDLSDAEKYEAVREIQNQIVELTRESLNAYENIRYEDDGEVANIGDRYYQKDDEGEWQKMSAEQVTKYQVTSAAGEGAMYASDGTNHYRWYEPSEDASEDAKAGWRKVTEKEYERQEEITSALDITPEEYWSNREEYSYAYENPESYAVAKAVGGYEAYTGYSKELNDIHADKDEYGQSINGSRKEKVQEYINNLDADYYTKIILWKSEYNSDDSNNYEIIEYLNGREDISYEEMEAILLKLGFKVDSEGNISW